MPRAAEYVSPGRLEDRQERRAAVFRHHSKLSEEQTGYYSYSAPPLSLSTRTVRRTTTLPIDYKAPVATLPYLRDDKEAGPSSLAMINSNLGESSL